MDTARFGGIATAGESRDDVRGRGQSQEEVSHNDRQPLAWTSVPGKEAQAPRAQEGALYGEGEPHVCT